MSHVPGGVIGGDEWEDLAVKVIRGLAMDGPRKASSGHPGTAMALAPLAHVLFSRVMKYDPEDPQWVDRDRFILSCGHVSILLYSMLHLTGYELSLEDLKEFRQLGSRTPGHPENELTVGVEVTTGPLGQGFANAVGMAVAERHLRAHFGEDLCDHQIWAIAGDGCLEEGISHEAASLAGHLGLGRLVCVYDDNHITIDGPTELALNDSAPDRFRAYNWHVIELGERSNDLEAIEQALRSGAAETERPTLIVLRSHIGWPSPRFTDSPLAHGNPFPPEEIEETKSLMGLPPSQTFWVPDEVLEGYRAALQPNRDARSAWMDRLQVAGERGERFLARMRGDMTEALRAAPPAFEVGQELATRRSFVQSLNATSSALPSVISGSADLTENTGTLLASAQIQDRLNPGGSQLHYGVREHGMAGVMTGMALHGGVLPVGGTFFVFSDYMRGAVRVAAISGAKVVYVWTHDSIGVGEDGPTHQPIEQLAALRAMPGLTVIRPADAFECDVAWRLALETPGPVAMVLSRQNLPILEETCQRARHGVAQGAYVLAELGSGDPEVVLVGTGSEVSLCMEAARILETDGVPSRIVSMPCFEWFQRLDLATQASVLPPLIPVLSVEAASTFGWSRYADASVGIDHFGASGPASEIFEQFGFTPERVAAAARSLMSAPMGPRRARP
jgi:transketolase